jgi:hypothetical protein
MAAQDQRVAVIAAALVVEQLLKPSSSCSNTRSSRLQSRAGCGRRGCARRGFCRGGRWGGQSSAACARSEAQPAAGAAAWSAPRERAGQARQHVIDRRTRRHRVICVCLGSHLEPLGLLHEARVHQLGSPRQDVLLQAHVAHPGVAPSHVDRRGRRTSNVCECVASRKNPSCV